MSTADSEWQRVSAVNTAEAYRLFLCRHSEAPQAPEARARLERRQWDEAVKRDDISAFEDYLAAYPSGSFAEGARAKTEQKRRTVMAAAAGTVAIDCHHGFETSADRRWNRDDRAEPRGQEMSVALEQHVANAMAMLGMKVVNARDKSADATLTIGLVRLALPQTRCGGHFEAMGPHSSGSARVAWFGFSGEVEFALQGVGKVFHLAVAGDIVKGQALAPWAKPNLAAEEAEYSRRRDTFVSSTVDGILAATVSYLGRNRFRESLPRVLAELKSENPMTRGTAAHALGCLGSVEAVDTLVQSGMADSDERVRRNACRALGRIGDKRAVPPLIAALADPESKDAAASALTIISGQDFGADQAKWQAWWSANQGSR
jgi:hypothetical protein